MWWEYLVVVFFLAAAFAYVIWFVARAFRPSSGCGSSACSCGTSDLAARERMPKVVPLVQLKPPAE